MATDIAKTGAAVSVTFLKEKEEKLLKRGIFKEKKRKEKKRF